MLGLIGKFKARLKSGRLTQEVFVTYLFSVSTLRLRLKDNTRDLHDQVEATALMSRLMRDDLGPSEYARTMRALHAVYAPLESALLRVDGLRAVLPDLSQRMKSPALEKDLAGLAGPEPTGGLLVAHPAVDWIATVPTALGVFYVLEGATMGGRLIASKLKTRPFVTPDTLNFFVHYGREHARYWQRFTAALDGVAPADWNEVVEAARRTFAMFIAAAEA